MTQTKIMATVRNWKLAWSSRTDGKIWTTLFFRKSSLKKHRGSIFFPKTMKNSKIGHGKFTYEGLCHKKYFKHVFGEKMVG